MSLEFITDTSAPFPSRSGYAILWVDDLGLWIAGGSRNIFGAENIARSADGVNWAGFTVFEPNSLVDDLAWSSSLARLVAVGSNQSADNGEAIASSDDGGQTWSVHSSFFDFADAHGVAWSESLGLFVAVGRPAGATGPPIITSPDGITWTPRTSDFDDTNMKDVIWAESLGIFVAVGEAGVLTSTNGTTWVTAFTDVFPDINAVAYAPSLGKFIAVGGTYYSSPTGATWTPFTGPAVTSNGIVWSPERAIFMLATSDPDDTVWTSPDGTTWTSSGSPFGSAFASADAVDWSASEDAFVVVGSDGDTLTISAARYLPFSVTVRDHDPPLWRVIVTAANSATLTCLDHRATDRTFLYTLNAAAYHSGQVPSDDPEIHTPWPDLDDQAVLSNNSRLLFAFRRETNADPLVAPWVVRFGGIITIPEDQGTDAPTTRYTAHDPWQYMMSRPARNPDTLALLGPDGYRYEPTDKASDIALAVLNMTEAIEGETHILVDEDLIEVSDDLGAPLTIDQTDSVGEIWNKLVNTGTIDIHLDPIYEPLIYPGKVCVLRVVKQTPLAAAGPVRHNAVLGWDQGTRSLSGISRMVDGTRLANVIAYRTGQGVPQSSAVTDATSISLYGQYWVQNIFPNVNDVTERELVQLLAEADLLIRRNGQRSITLDVAPERSQLLLLRDVDLGDYVPVWATNNLREPLGVDYDTFDPDAPGAAGYQRIYAIPITLDDNGVEVSRGLLTSRDSTTN